MGTGSLLEPPNLVRPDENPGTFCQGFPVLSLSFHLDDDKDLQPRLGLFFCAMAQHHKAPPPLAGGPCQAASKYAGLVNGKIYCSLCSLDIRYIRDIRPTMRVARTSRPEARRGRKAETS